MKVNVISHTLNKAIKVMSKLKNTKEGIQIIAPTAGSFVFRRSNWFTSVLIDGEDYLVESGAVEIPWELKNSITALDGNITITENRITAGSRDLSYMPKYFPEISASELEEPLLFETSEAELYRMINIGYSIAQDETRPILRGIYFKENETCALDEYRLAVRIGDYSCQEEFVLNNDTAEFLKSVLDKRSTNQVKVYKAGDKIVFLLRKSSVTVIGSIIKGEFLNYKQIVPKYADLVCKVEAEDLLKELKPIKGKSDVLKLTFTKNEIHYSADIINRLFDKEASDLATTEKRFKAHADYLEKCKKHEADKLAAKKKNKPFSKLEPVEAVTKPQKVYTNIKVSEITGQTQCKFDGEEFKIHVNPNYVIDALEQYTGDVEIWVTSRVSPIVITKDGHNLDLVLPVRMVE